ncbi:MAG: hypothetical protein QJT81_02280 [Candidatus Thiothrix putei]|uniref:Uncharacterized protein n=1 Tax=Candidatus Thiothrix putei TaxID=3080811 RepID=A0AA95HHE0_9GAMM|nr:MAG: hypothetical protein QJT81_02280 [Candidatus Thiothrix putei]
MGDCIQRTEDIVALASGRGADEQPGETPQEPQKRGQDKMGGVDKENGAFSGLGLLKTRLQLFF